MNHPQTTVLSQGEARHTTTISPEALADEWRQSCERYPQDILSLVKEMVTTHKAALATCFYDHMMQDPSASFFLSDKLVKSKLHTTMQTWMTMVFSAASNQSYHDVVLYQEKIGEVHARIGIPTHLVMRGARALNQGIFRLLVNADEHQRTAAVTYITDVSNLAIEIMCHAYATFHDRNARSEESYRQFAISQNIGSEKERQRAALLDWENQLMFEMTINAGNTQIPTLSNAEFGLWFLHKASHMFEGSADVATIQEYIRQIDLTIAEVTASGSTSAAITALKSIREQSKAIAFLLSGLFEQASALESGRDTLTNLLNRKYLHVIMNREIGYARRNGTGLAVLVVDVDHFKKVNDSYGHDNGDIVLHHLSTVMTMAIRGSDYIFRLGGEEFLIVLTDISQNNALQVADNLRRRIQNEVIRTSDGTQMQVTLSIGLAMHNGHPDYLRLLKAADQALYKAKHNGRNQVVVHTDNIPQPVPA
jgi:diguanylate cyclase